MSLTIHSPDDNFNVPLDLLLYLIRRDEVDIYDIDIARLANSYIEEMGKLKHIDVDEGAEFLDLASRLLEIKSRMLIPPDELDGDPEEDEENIDPRTGLVEALLEYRRFKDAAKLLGDMAEEQSRRYPRTPPRFEFTAADTPLPAAGANDLMRAFQNLLDKMLTEFSDKPDVISYTEVSIATRMRQIEDNLLAVEKTRFSRLLSDRPTRGEMVGFFVAILELVRQGRLVARQSGDFSDIVIERREPPLKTSATATPAFRPRRAVFSFPSPPPRVRRPPARRTEKPFPAAFSPPRPRSRRRPAKGIPALFPAVGRTRKGGGR